MSNENLVFVYGSLMRGYHNHDVIAFDFETHDKNKGHDYYGKTKTVDKFKMYDMGSFPAISFDDNGHEVAGELYAVDDATLELIDMLEGFPNHYNRKQVELSNGATAWVYFYENPEDELVEFDNIVNGVYSWEL